MNIRAYFKTVVAMTKAADELDQLGFTQEADMLEGVIVRLSQAGGMPGWDTIGDEQKMSGTPYWNNISEPFFNNSGTNQNAAMAFGGQASNDSIAGSTSGINLSDYPELNMHPGENSQTYIARRDKLIHDNPSKYPQLQQFINNSKNTQQAVQEWYHTRFPQVAQNNGFDPAMAQYGTDPTLGDYGDPNYSGTYNPQMNGQPAPQTQQSGTPALAPGAMPQLNTPMITNYTAPSQ